MGAKRLWVWLLDALAVLAVVAALGPETLKFVKSDNDPRARVGSWTLILHQDGRAALRMPNGLLRQFNYHSISEVGMLYFFGWLMWAGVRWHAARGGSGRRISGPESGGSGSTGAGSGRL